MNKFSALILTAAAFSSGAAEYWVDRSRPDDSGDGRTAASAKRTLQAGVDLLQDGDTLYVLPGDYDEGGRAERTVNQQTNRVSIMNVSNVRIVSTHGKAVTRIVGKHSAEGRGTYSDSIRCIFSDGGAGIRIEGFTLLDGASGAGNENASSINSGGGFYGRYLDTNAADPDYGMYVFADCDFVNCRAHFGGAASRAALVRCRVMGCRAQKHGAALYYGAMLNCQVNQNEGGYNILRKTVCYNTTVADNSASTGIAYDSTLVNSVIIHNGSGFVGYGDNSLTARYGVFSKDDGKDFKSKDGCNTSPAAAYQFTAPLYDDYRPLASSDLAGAAKAEELASFRYVGEEERYLDLDRRAIAKEGVIAAGCHQTSVTARGGVMKMADASDYTTRGRKPRTGGLYACAEHWPTQFLVQGIASLTRRPVYFSVDGATTYPLLDDSVWILPPESPEAAVTVKVVASDNNVRYVNAATGRDDDAGYDGTSPEKAYKTIQRGVDDSPGVVVVAAGEYKEGCRLHSGGGATSNRLVIAENCGLGIRIVGAGADRTTIRGASATYDRSTVNPGCGPDAVRCIFANHSCCIQGFTIADGRVVDGKVDVDTNGGGVYGGWNQSVRIVDCVITNCAAYRGDAVHGGDVRRTKIIDCGNGYGQLSRYASFQFCLFAGAHSAGAYGDDNCDSYNCTYIGNASAPVIFSDKAETRLNCIVARASKVGSNVLFDGGLVYDSDSVAAAGEYVAGDPYFIDIDGLDGRVMASTEAAGAGIFYEKAPQYMIGDIDGRPMRFTGGRPAAGAYQTVTPGIRVTRSDRFGEQSWSGVRELKPGETVSVTASDDEGRHCAGFRVNGVDVPSEPASWSVTLPDPLKGDECFVVEPIWSTNWYVNANTDPDKGPVGDDGNSGFTPATPKRTLAAILSSEYVLAGDCVHAAPGVYNEGSMAQLYAARKSDAESLTTPVRARVKAGVTLVGDGGAENTFIVGERKSGESEAGRFQDVTAGMRCLNLDNGAKVVGFTVTGGSTPYTASSGEKEPYLGGGIVGPLSAKSVQPVVADCIISNNWACRGGGAFGTSLVNCRIFENYVTEDGVAAMCTKLVNCLVDRNYGDTETGEALVRYPLGIYGSTLTDRNVVLGTDTPIKWHVYSWEAQGGHPIANSVIMGSLEASVAHALENCIVNGEAAELGDRSKWNAGTRAMTVAEMKLEEDTFVPMPDSPALNAGAAGRMVEALTGGFTLDGAQRVYHGAVDIGCREFDYRGLFAAAIGGGVRVESATAGVTLENGAVKLVDGESVSGVWPAVGGKGRYTVLTAAEGEGTLTGVLADGASEFVRNVASSDSEDRLEFRLKDTALDFEFSYAGDGAGYLAGFGRYVPGTVLFVR